MTCGECGTSHDDLRAVPGRPHAVYCPPCRKDIAAKHGRTAMNNLTAAEKTELSESGGNALLRMMGSQYYVALGRRSAAQRAKRLEAEA
jgi:hypothetical protein